MQIRQRVQQDPNYLQELLAELQHSNPAWYAAIQQNPQAFRQLLFEPGTQQELGPEGAQGEEEENEWAELPDPEGEGGDGPVPAPGHPEPMSIGLSEEERQAVGRVGRIPTS